jgi:glycine cleavage system H protein
VEVGKAFGDLESVKAVSDVYSPVTGVVSAINEALLDAPEQINVDPYTAWFIKVEKIEDHEDLMDHDQYELFCAREEQ